MNEFRNIDTGELYSSEEYRLDICPKCRKKMLRNSYKSLEVISSDESINDVSISITMEYCSKHGLYIRTDY